MAAIFTPGFTFAVGTTYGNNVVGDVDMATFISAMSITSVGETGATFAQSAIGLGAMNNGITGIAGTSVAALRRLATDGAAVTADMALGAGDPRVGRAEKFKTSGSDVTLSTTAPTTGKVIIATSATAAEWGTVNASAINGTGKVDITTDVNFVEHVLGTFPTNFLSELKVGYLVQVGTQIRRIVTIASDTAATVDSAWDSTLSDQTFTFFISSPPRPFNLTLAKTNADTPVSVQVADAGTTFTADTTAGNVQFDLPVASTVPDGSTFTFKKISDDTNSMMVAPNGTDQIDGVNASLTLKTLNSYVVLQATGSSWIIVDKYAFTGDVIQSVATFTGTSVSGFLPALPIDSSIPQFSEGQAFPALDTMITPRSSNSLLRVTVVSHISNSQNNTSAAIALFKDASMGTDPAVAAAFESAGSSQSTVDSGISLRYEAASGGVSAITFTVRFGSPSGSIRLGSSTFGGIVNSSLVIEEIAI